MPQALLLSTPYILIFRLNDTQIHHQGMKGNRPIIKLKHFRHIYIENNNIEHEIKTSKVVILS